MIGEFLYQLTRKDAATQPVLQRRIDNSRTAQAIAAVVVDGPVIPADKWGILTGASVDCVSGAAQTVSDFDLFIVDSAGNEQMTIFKQYRTAIANAAFEVVGTYVWLAPGERLRARGFFNAGAAVNTVNLDAHFILIPPGTLQLR